MNHGTDLLAASMPHPLGYREATPAQVAAGARKYRTIDVREPEEFTGELGHIEGAELFPLGRIESDARTWPRDETLLMVCRSGGRSGRASAMLTAMGFQNVINMAGGMLAWNEAKLPIEGR